MIRRIFFFLLALTSTLTDTELRNEKPSQPHASQPLTTTYRLEMSRQSNPSRPQQSYHWTTIVASQWLTNLQRFIALENLATTCDIGGVVVRGHNPDLGRFTRPFNDEATDDRVAALTKRNKIEPTLTGKFVGQSHCCNDSWWVLLPSESRRSFW